MPSGQGPRSPHTSYESAPCNPQCTVPLLTLPAVMLISFCLDFSQRAFTRGDRRCCLRRWYPWVQTSAASRPEPASSAEPRTLTQAHACGHTSRVREQGCCSRSGAPAVVPLPAPEPHQRQIRRTKITGARLAKYVYTPECEGCRYMQIGLAESRNHSEKNTGPEQTERQMNSENT